MPTVIFKFIRQKTAANEVNLRKTVFITQNKFPANSTLSFALKYNAPKTYTNFVVRSWRSMRSWMVIDIINN